MILPSEILGKPKSKRLSDIIDITSPAAFKRSIEEIKKDGVTRKEVRALSLAKGAATLQLARKNLSDKERKQFKTIQGMRLPKVTSMEILDSIL